MSNASQLRKRQPHDATDPRDTVANAHLNLHASPSNADNLVDAVSQSDVVDDKSPAANDEPKTETNFRKDWLNIVLLIVLYLLQGVPLGLALGSIPFLLKAKLSYAQIAVFSLASYPYSLKLFWSPIVDSLYFKSFGRRKTWIVPIQLIIGSLFLWLGQRVDHYLDDPVPHITGLTWLFFIIVLLSATQDIAVDGWALTLLSKENMSYASSCQTIGLTTGYFLSFTVFLALNSVEFCNAYLRSVPGDQGILSLGGYMQFWASLYFVVTLWLVLFKTEKPDGENDYGIVQTYRTIWDIIRLPHMRTLIIIMLCAKLGFITNESVSGLKLLEKGFHKEDLALTVLVDFPFQIIFGYYTAKWSSGNNPLRPWIYAFVGRLLFSLVGMAVVLYCPVGSISATYFVMVMATTVLSSFMSNVQFVSISVFMTSIADPAIGGTYMTLLNTISNFGGTWPKYFILEAVDYFTQSACSVRDKSGTEFSCTDEAGKQQCSALQGQCVILQDGYYLVNTACVVLGGIIFVAYIMPNIYRLVRMPTREWHLQESPAEPVTKED